MRKRYHFLCAATALICAGCTPAGKSDVQRQYVTDVRSLDITPVYPPSEAFQLGDVFLVLRMHRDPSAPPAVDQSESEEIKIANLPLLREYAERALQGRIAFSDTAVAAGSTGASVTQNDLVLGQVDSIGNRGQAIALPSVAFPKVSADAGSVYGWAPARGFLGLNFSGSQRTTVTLDFKDVRTIAAPKISVAGPIGASLGRRETQQSCEAAVRLMVDRLTEKLAGKTSGSSQPIGIDIEYKVITQLFLTRQIDYTYSSKAIFAAAQESLAKGATGTANYGPTVVVGTGTTAADLNSTLAALQKQNTSGATLGTFDERGITLNRTFQKPVAVGYDALSYKFCQVRDGDTASPGAGCAAGLKPISNVQLSVALSAKWCANPLEIYPSSPSPRRMTPGAGTQRVTPSL